MSISLGPTILRDTPAEVARVVAAIEARNTGMERPMLSGSADELAERVRAYRDLGFTNVLYHLAPPYDDETLERFIAEVKPQVA
jgi:alkanesulfonate monooxygenase SsuD/methylene tetrahydromethanopterin reductase-like flavin-dependent oxidoreductase (luciferase family)